MKNNNGKLKEKRIKIQSVIIIAVLIIAAGIMVSTVIAKYYAYKSEPGIAVASAFYFSSNKLEKLNGATDKDSILTMDTSNLAVSVNENKWVSGECLFPIEIRNYDNNLLFNEKDLDAEYEICFRLIGVPAGAEYVAAKTENGNIVERQQLTVDNGVVYFTGKLEGGTLAGDEYQLIVTLTDGQAYDDSVKVLVVAYPTKPDYLYSADEQEHRLVGLFQGHLSEAEMDIESADFIVQSDTDYNETSWRDKVQGLSGLIFNVKTNGDVITDDSNTVKQEAVVKWNSKYLQISKYDECYIKAKNKAAGSAEEAADPSWWEEKQDENGDTWIYMKIEALPYTSINITFYKTQEFLDKFNDTANQMTQEEFENLAGAYVEKD